MHAILYSIIEYLYECVHEKHGVKGFFVDRYRSSYQHEWGVNQKLRLEANLSWVYKYEFALNIWKDQGSYNMSNRNYYLDIFEL